MKCTICDRYEVAKFDVVVPEYHKESLCKHCLAVFNYTSYKLTYDEFKQECINNLLTYESRKAKARLIQQKARTMLDDFKTRQNAPTIAPKCAGCGSDLDLEVGCCDTTELTRELLEN